MKGKKVITYAVSFLVALGCVSAFPMTVQADTGYEVYPNPHTMSYSNGDYEMTSQVNVVYEDGIDADTKARLTFLLVLRILINMLISILVLILLQAYLISLIHML